MLITLISAANPIPRTPHAREWLHWYIIRFDLNTKSWDPHDVLSRTGNLPINNHSAPAHYGISAEVALCPGQRSTLWNKYFNKCNSYIPTTISKYIIAFLFNFNCSKFPQTHFVKAINHAKCTILIPKFTFALSESDLTTTLKILNVCNNLDLITYAHCACAVFFLLTKSSRLELWGKVFHTVITDATRYNSYSRRLCLHISRMDRWISPKKSVLRGAIKKKSPKLWKKSIIFLTTPLPTPLG